jgi:methylisocitrate lyase
MPGVHDAISAKVFEAAGFKAVQCSSWGIAAAAGLPEGGIHSWADHREAIRKIVRAVNIPANADVEDGYGGPYHVRQVVRELIQIGAAGTNLEDRAWRASPQQPTRIIPLDDMLEKINAVVETRRQEGSEFFLNARTDALTVSGADPDEMLEEAVRRGNAFAQAGADLVFIWGAPTREQIRSLTTRINAPVAISGHAIKLTVPELQELGVARVSYGSASVNVAAGAVHRLGRAILDQGSPAAVDDLAHAFDARRAILG